MPRNNSLRRLLENTEHDAETGDDANYVDFVFVPEDDRNSTDNSDVYESEDENFDEGDISGGSYEYYFEKYDSKMKLLEPDHNYEWINGEYLCGEFSTEEKIFLSDEQEGKISEMSSVQLFELFFCKKIKNDIIGATLANNYDLSLNKLNAFLGILITSIINSRKHERDFWSTNSLLHHKRVHAVMSRNEFLQLKRKLKLSKPTDLDRDDKIWKVRSVLEIFRKNLQQFGYFSSILSIDESMIKFFGRCKIKQFMKNKPVRFGLKFWSICTVSGYLLDLDIYCGKGSKSRVEKFENLNLGTDVVMMMLHNFLENTPKEKLTDYHIGFDNFFTSPDLMVHLKKLGLKATGTVRQNRVYEYITEKDKKGKLVEKKVTVPISIDKNADRGTCEVKHDEVSKINFVSVKDSKIVSVLSSAAGVTPKVPVKRYSAQDKSKVDTLFPQGVRLYNKSMGGVDLYDQHCSDLSVNINSKKWTFAFLKRMVETSLSNATVIHNLCTEGKKKEPMISL